MPEKIKVRVNLFATLRKFLPPGADEGVTLELAAGSTVSDAISTLGIPADHAGMVVSDDDQVEAGSPLRDGQELSVFPPLVGG